MGVPAACIAAALFCGGQQQQVAPSTHLGRSCGMRECSVRLGGYFSKGDVVLNAARAATVLDQISLRYDKIDLSPLLRSYNPDIKVYAQDNTSLLFHGSYAGAFQTGEPLEWRLRETTGVIVLPPRFQSAGIMKVYAMDVANPRYQSWWRRTRAERLRDGRLDGFVADEPPSLLYEEWGRTDLRGYPDVYSKITATAAWLDTVRLGGVKVLINAGQWTALTAGGEYFGDLLIDHASGAWFETWLRPYWGRARQPTLDVWEKTIEWTERLGRDGRPAILAYAYDEREISELETGVATYLLAKTSETLVFQPFPIDPTMRMRPGLAEFASETSAITQGYSLRHFLRTYDESRALFDVRLGVALEGRTDLGGHLYRRRFRAGVVVVNPTAEARETTTRDLLGTAEELRSVRGTPISGRIRIPPHSGRILLHRSR